MSNNNNFTLASCSKSKQEGTHLAKNLYEPSPIFRKRRKYAHQNGGKWGILSAEFGYLRPWDIVPYYQTHISERANIWGAFVLGDLLADLRYYDIDQVTILAGSRYIQPLIDQLEVEGYEVNDFNEGLMPGERMQALNEANESGTQTSLEGDF